ncbi:hypothetical protein [Sphingobium cupriresistens]|uniref:Uncharacterized protein n=1 Tax=Sphingobium cupriresistens TaxID=1132417 RepID=A0A8G2DW83_9SPHN|nr:hypothetical protein [Sphingobium cupriresistens]RYM05720.1 hypothetical protein EWH12_20975 [Sphingobium cupriresistens]
MAKKPLPPQLHVKFDADFMGKPAGRITHLTVRPGDSIRFGNWNRERLENKNTEFLLNGFDDYEKNNRIEDRDYSKIISVSVERISSVMDEIYRDAGIDNDKHEKVSRAIANILVAERSIESGGAIALHDIVEHVSSPQSAKASNKMPPFPAEAPIRWKDRVPGETAPDFARRVYGPYGLAEGIPKRALRNLDAALVNELNTWVREGNEMPADVQLLTKGEENDRLLSAGDEAIKEHLGKFTGAEAVREAQRLNNARYRKR